jgi:cytochrome c oxidase assembly factor CtaG
MLFWTVVSQHTIKTLYVGVFFILAVTCIFNGFIVHYESIMWSLKVICTVGGTLDPIRQQADLKFAFHQSCGNQDCATAPYVPGP